MKPGLHGSLQSVLLRESARWLARLPYNVRERFAPRSTFIDWHTTFISLPSSFFLQFPPPIRDPRFTWCSFLFDCCHEKRFWLSGSSFPSLPDLPSTSQSSTNQTSCPSPMAFSGSVCSVSHHYPKSMASTTLSKLENRSWIAPYTGMSIEHFDVLPSSNLTVLVTHLPFRCIIIFLADAALPPPPRLLIMIYDWPPDVHH